MIKKFYLQFTPHYLSLNLSLHNAWLHRLDLTTDEQKDQAEASSSVLFKYLWVRIE